MFYLNVTFLGEKVSLSVVSFSQTSKRRRKPDFLCFVSVGMNYAAQASTREGKGGEHEAERELLLAAGVSAAAHRSDTECRQNLIQQTR